MLNALLVNAKQSLIIRVPSPLNITETVKKLLLSYSSSFVYPTISNVYPTFLFCVVIASCRIRLNTSLFSSFRCANRAMLPCFKL